MSVTTVRAQTSNAYENANCGASFLNSCPNQETIVAAESGPVAAPLPTIGIALWELCALLAGFGGAWLARRRRLRHPLQLGGKFR